jgi:hypothetical protein
LNANRWTTANVARLRELWDGGRSAREIAGEFGKGWSRNMVIGKIHRLGLWRADKPVIAPPTERRTFGKPPPPKIKAEKFGDPAKQQQPRPAVVRVFPGEAHSGPPVSVEDVQERHCRWPIGEPFQGFCGADKIDGRSYCGHHAGMSVIRSKPMVRPVPAKQVAARY